MMSATIRRKALSLCSSAVANNGIVQSLERTQPALAGSASRGYVAGIPMFEGFGKKSKLVPEFHQGAPVYSKPLRDVVSSRKTDFPTHTWSRSFFTHSEPAKIEKIVNTSVKRTHTGPAYFTATGAVAGSVLSTPIVNAPQAAKLGMGSTVSPTFLPNLALFWHINNGIEEILADYVHHEMTRSLVLVMMRLFLIVAAKDVFVATN
ncbi:putative fumarate reductase/succinate dehydrogenase, transmembrane subunit [Helianthus annuus]|nr:putative fumarate reductase/succinate dehydrogenase, transmembrane subunit [Helianthus annuus]